MVGIENRQMPLGAAMGKTYLQMAKEPLQFAEAPYGYRVLSPSIVSVLPFDPAIGFAIVNITSLSLATTLLYIYMNKLGIDEILSVAGSFVFLFSPNIAHMLRNIHIIDPLGFVFLLIGLISIYDNNLPTLFISVFFGILTKESLLILVGIYGLTVLQRESLKQSIKKTLPLGVVGITSYIIPRVVFPYQSTYTIENIIYVTGKLINGLASFNFRFYASLFAVYGTFWVIFPLGLRKIDKPILKASAIGLIPVFFQVFIGDGYSRLMFWGFAFVIPISLYYFSERSGSFFDTNVVGYVPLITTIVGLFGVLYLLSSNWASGWLTVSAIMITAHEGIILYLFKFGSSHQVRE
jgi:hypothetical protein